MPCRTPRIRFFGFVSELAMIRQLKVIAEDNPVCGYLIGYCEELMASGSTGGAGETLVRAPEFDVRQKRLFERPLLLPRHQDRFLSPTATDQPYCGRGRRRLPFVLDL